MNHNIFTLTVDSIRKVIGKMQFYNINISYVDIPDSACEINFPLLPNSLSFFSLPHFVPSSHKCLLRDTVCQALY